MPLWALIVFEGTAEKPEQSSNLFALIPVVFAVILFLCNGGLKKENKFISHLAVMFTLITIIAIYMKPFSYTLGDYNTNNSTENIMRIVRSGIMILTGILSMITFVKSFINARKKKS